MSIYTHKNRRAEKLFYFYAYIFLYSFQCASIIACTSFGSW